MSTRFPFQHKPARRRRWLTRGTRNRNRNRRAVRAMRMSALGGLAVGAGAMYMLDPERGRRRRAVARDRALRQARRAADAASGLALNARNRARGAIAETAARLRDAPVEDRVLEERVRSRLGHVAHLGLLEVSADHGRVLLRGPVLAQEADALISTAWSVRGVREVESHLDIRPRDTGAADMHA